MKHGLTAAQLNYLLETVVRPLRLHGAKVWLFGSRARGDHQQYSDVDLMIEGETVPATLIASIREQLSTGNFPFKVDLVSIDDFAAAYRQNFEQEKLELTQ